MTQPSERGSIFLKLLVGGAIVAALAFYKDASGKSYLEKVIGTAQSGKQYMMDQAQTAKTQLQTHEDATQKELDK